MENLEEIQDIKAKISKGLKLNISETQVLLEVLEEWELTFKSEL
jgi:hypothetical protein